MRVDRNAPFSRVRIQIKDAGMTAGIGSARLSKSTKFMRSSMQMFYLQGPTAQQVIRFSNLEQLQDGTYLASRASNFAYLINIPESPLYGVTLPHQEPIHIIKGFEDGPIIPGGGGRPGPPH